MYDLKKNLQFRHFLIIIANTFIYRWISIILDSNYQFVNKFNRLSNIY